MSENQNKGQLVIIGGAEEKNGDAPILREFVRRAGGVKANIVIMTAATELPREVGEKYIEVFQRLGASEVRIIDTTTREDASSSTALEAIHRATGIFFTGGEQARITSILKNTEIDAAIHKRHSEGAVVAGTSAGAAVMPDKMIVEGDSQTSARLNIVEMGPGLGFLPGVVIDQHFSERGRLGRLITALVQEPVVLGFGIDENTAMVVSDGQIEVFGEGSVTIVDESEGTYNNMDQILKDEPLAVCGVKLHILPHGHKFDLKTRQPILDRQTSVTRMSVT
ncbi:cyanophycinase [Anabaena cylindrica FACHB-243]|uniref:Cyanophycinase n=1 Tax=Anabaena cylindrica (strain ATCC 27899 / PCC 7122) TaxID=272123 RepID=K9ZN05_ANACC|nr:MULTISPECIES: cyanophycinase [Anabaena]AFZ59932.1 cyanophycinase [Anabaena cylindrica PCC 7122]MBD2419025.1 cyanophycinase [Anabaena cylindrica FACHB-243]MBY5282693.1 cyanophycinase [Anabaena sp. CCAP 1446/1C]MBY5307569.1 cyanophycinase [Anabaena sp. CCAP 1446/1C]MCM2407835.1 cyanophycinase [Anabaena sp. CCAP 1446/1C]